MKARSRYRIDARAAVAAIALAIGGIAATTLAQPSQDSADLPWSQCCGTHPWSWPHGGMGRGMMGRGMMGGRMMGGGMAGSLPRQHYAMMQGIPAAYRSMSNPLPRTRETVEKGRAVYERNCASCHGETGAGDGPAGLKLSPPPANLAWLSQMPLVQWDPFMRWTVAEGGAQFGSAMPAFKGILSDDDSWAVIAYIQARLPQKSR